MLQRLLPVLYAIEFLVALIAVFTVWREVGGANHVDYMQWYWKAAIGFPLAYATVRLTMAMAGADTGRSQGMTLWLMVLIGLVAAAIALTYYTHLNEPQDGDDQEAGSVTPAAVRPAGRGRVGVAHPGGRRSHPTLRRL